MGRKEHQPLPDGMFEIFGDRRMLQNLNYRNHLKIHNCSSKELNGSVVYCGSYENPIQNRFEFKVCGMSYDFLFHIDHNYLNIQRNQL